MDDLKQLKSMERKSKALLKEARQILDEQMEKGMFKINTAEVSRATNLMAQAIPMGVNAAFALGKMQANNKAKHG